MSGSITGNVLDTDGNAVEGVTVTAIDADTETEVATVETNSSGDYSVSVPDDTYDVRAEKRGYLTDKVTGVTVSGGTVTAPNHELFAATYKTRGENGEFGYGVLGRATSTSGDPVGVRGVAPNTSEGFGLSTPGDARVDGDLEATSGHTLTAGGTTVFRTGLPGADGFGNTASGNVVGGSKQNTAAGTVGSTIAGGGINSNSVGHEVTDNYGTIGGGAGNRAGDSQSGNISAYAATVAGGSSNVAGNRLATVGGGDNNDAMGKYSGILGGVDNKADGSHSAILGGETNETKGKYAAVGGGYNNSAYDRADTIGGGSGNRTGTSGSVLVHSATVGGGSSNEAYGLDSTIGGGSNNRTGQSGTSIGQYATVPGGRDNIATGDHSFAAGREAEARDDGTFVWADSTSGTFTSTISDSFLVEAGGGVGINETQPRTQLHVTNNSDSSGLTNHTALIEDTNSQSARGLAIKLGDSSPSDLDNYITFYDADDNYQGAVEGDGSEGVQLDGTTADYGEYMPKHDAEADIEAADVVGVVDGAVTKRTDEAGQALVVSDRSIVTGNSPGPDPTDREDHEVCAFVGQVPVRVRGSVDYGDLLVPSGDHDGTARSIAPAAYRPGDGPLVGRAWESTDEDGVSEVTVAIGLENGGAMDAALADQREQIEYLRSEGNRKADRIDALESETEQLRGRLAALEERVAAIDATGTATPADD